MKEKTKIKWHYLKIGVLGVLIENTLQKEAIDFSCKMHCSPSKEAQKSVSDLPNFVV